MLRLRDSSIFIPELYPKVIRQNPTLKEKGFVEIGGHILRDNIDLAPQVGIQENCISCDADIIFMAGAATMGKTFTLMLDSLKGLGRQNYTASLISKRLVDSQDGGSINRDFKAVYGKYAGSNLSMSGYPTASWKQWNSSIRLLHSNYNIDNPKEWDEFQEYAKKNQSSWIGFDELTDFPFKMWAYWMSRNRDNSGMRPRSLATFNPKYEHFTRTIIDWYLDETHHVIPERLGVVRYMYIGKAKSERDIIWGMTPEEVIAKAEIKVDDDERALGMSERDMVKSFTFLSGKASDNRILVHATQGGSIANLHNSGDADRLLYGYFGPIDDSETKVSNKMIADLFENAYDTDETMYATTDVSGGGDICNMVIWKGLTIIAMEQLDMSEIAESQRPERIRQWIRDMLRLYSVPMENFAFDATGIGFFLKEFEKGFPVTANKAQIQEYDENGNAITMERYFNVRSQLMGKAEALFKMGLISCSIDRNTIYPHGSKKVRKTLYDILIEEKDVFRRTTKNERIYYLKKDEFKARYKYSPDYMDSIIYRMVFELDARPRKTAEVEYTEEDYVALWED